MLARPLLTILVAGLEKESGFLLFFNKMWFFFYLTLYVVSYQPALPPSGTIPRELSGMRTGLLLLYRLLGIEKGKQDEKDLWAARPNLYF